MFTCVICNNLLGESTCSTECGHIFHHDCILEWLNRSQTCPSCRSHVGNLIKLYLAEDIRFQVKTTEELDLMVKKLRTAGSLNLSHKSTIKDLRCQLSAKNDDLKQAQCDYKNLNELYHSTLAQLNHVINKSKHTDNFSLDDLYNIEKSKKTLLQKEVYELRSINSAELNKLKSEIHHLKSEKEYFQQKCHDNQPSTSSQIITRSRSVLLRQIQSRELQPSSKGFLSNCHFWIVDELRKVSKATNHLDFNEHRVMEYGGTVAYHYSNMVTHVIGISQKNAEVLRGMTEHKKCATDYWLSDIIGEKKIRKPWLAHHFPVPYRDDDLPYKNKQIAIFNFDKNEYHIVKAMAEVAGASVINKISRSTDIVICLKLGGEMIKKALSLRIPVVNIQWLNDVLVGKQIGIQDFKNSKYQQFDLCDPFSMNYDRVSHLLEAWKERSYIPKTELVSNNVNFTLKRKKLKTCFIHDFSKFDVNNGGNTIISVLTIPMIDVDSCNMFPENSNSQAEEIKKEDITK